MRSARPEIFVLEELYRVHREIDLRQLVRVKEIDERVVTLVDYYLMNDPVWDVSRVSLQPDRLTHLRITTEVDEVAPDFDFHRTNKSKIELIFERWPHVDVVYHLSIKKDALTEREYGPDHWFDYTPVPAGSYQDLTQFSTSDVIADIDHQQREFLRKYEADKG